MSICKIYSLLRGQLSLVDISFVLCLAYQVLSERMFPRLGDRLCKVDYQALSMDSEQIFNRDVLLLAAPRVGLDRHPGGQLDMRGSIAT
jgi:hypothetical protein